MHRAMKRTNHGYIKVFCLLKSPQYLCAIFSNNIHIVTPRFFKILFFIICIIGKNTSVEHAKSTKRISREKNLFRFLIGESYFRPMNHRRRNKSQLMVPQVDHQFFVCPDVSFRHGFMKILLKHFQRCRRRANLCFRIPLCQFQQRTGMIRLHVIYDDIIQRAVMK